jgi:hypothetical protein
MTEQPDDAKKLDKTRKIPGQKPENPSGLCEAIKSEIARQEAEIMKGLTETGRMIDQICTQIDRVNTVVEDNDNYEIRCPKAKCRTHSANAGR